MSKLRVGQKWVSNEGANVEITEQRMDTKGDNGEIVFRGKTGDESIPYNYYEDGRWCGQGLDGCYSLKTLIYCPSWGEPAGRIQGVDMYVRPYADGPEVCIADAPSYGSTKLLVKRDGSMDRGAVGTKLNATFPTRDAAIARIRELEQKEKPVIDLTTAKFGDRFVQRNGEVSPPYACPHNTKDGCHVFQDGTIRSTNSGKRWGDSDHDWDLVKPYVEPRVETRWVMMWNEGKSSATFTDEKAAREHVAMSRYKLFCAPVKVTLTEGEGL